MAKNNKAAAGGGNTQAAQQNNNSFNFNQIIETLKTACFRAAFWLSVMGSVLL
jgi:hypothetical protein